MDKLIEKAKKSTWWKWLFAILIAFGVLFLLWMIRRKNNQLRHLRAEKLLAEEQAKDFAAQAELQDNASIAHALREESGRLVAEADKVDKKIKKLESDLTIAKKKVQDATTWSELEE